MAVEDALETHLADAFEGADEEGINRDEVAGVAGFNVALPEFWAKPLKQFHLIV